MYTVNNSSKDTCLLEQSIKILYTVRVLLLQNQLVDCGLEPGGADLGYGPGRELYFLALIRNVA